MGNWQLRAWVDCNWSCDGGCPCECEADCNVSFVIKKNYTFHTGYNSLNNSFGVRLMNAVASLGQLMTQGNLHANYVLWSEGSDVYGFTVRKRCQ